jgi:hypothetical protein
MDESKRQLPHYDLMELFRKPSFREKARKVFHGLGQPRESGGYKYAHLQLLRLMAPLAAIVVPVVAVFLLVVLGAMEQVSGPAVEVQIIEPEAAEKLEDVKDILEEPPDMPKPVDMEFTADVTLDHQAPVVSDAQPMDANVPQAALDSVAMIKSPVIMKGIFGSRSPGGRRRAIAEYGNAKFGMVGEDAVIRALRWLKKYQLEDGSWPMTPAGLGPAVDPKQGN